MNIFDMGKVGKYMYHCIRYLYGVLGCVVHPGVWGVCVWEGGGKRKDGRVDTTRPRNLRGIESGGGLL